MKTFKELKEKVDSIMEYSTLSQLLEWWPPGEDAWSAVDGKGSHNVEKEQAVAEVNMFIARNLNHLVSDPIGAINLLRAKLNFVGLDFEADNQQMATEGNLDFPVTRHGGSFGTVPTHDLRQGFYRDSGIMGMQMALRGTLTLESTGYRISLKLVPVEDAGGLEAEDPSPERGVQGVRGSAHIAKNSQGIAVSGVGIHGGE